MLHCCSCKPRKAVLWRLPLMCHYHECWVLLWGRVGCSAVTAQAIIGHQEKSLMLWRRWQCLPWQSCCIASRQALLLFWVCDREKADSLRRDLEAAVSSSSDKHTPSSSTVYHSNGLAIKPTEWMVVGLDGWHEQNWVLDRCSWHTMEKVIKFSTVLSSLLVEAADYGLLLWLENWGAWRERCKLVWLIGSEINYWSEWIDESNGFYIFY